MGRRLLTRFDPYGLGEHVERNRFVPRLKLAITAKAVHILQEILLAADCGP
jgi:hypothetical protein